MQLWKFIRSIYRDLVAVLVLLEVRMQRYYRGIGAKIGYVAVLVLLEVRMQLGIVGPKVPGDHRVAVLVLLEVRMQPVYREVPGSAVVKGLPDPEPGRYFVTSAMVARAAQRPDVFSPNTHPKYVKRTRRAGPIESVCGLVSYI